MCTIISILHIISRIRHENDSSIQFDDILGPYKSTTFSPTHVTTHYNPTTTHQTGIFRLLLCKVLISYTIHEYDVISTI